MATPKSFADLAALWVTGYTPSQTDFQNLFASFENVVDDNLLIGQAEGITPVTPSSQGTATLLTKKINLINNDAAGPAACKLPPAVKGAICFVVQATSNPFDLYPSSGDMIFPISSDAPIQPLANALYMFVCIADFTWLVISNEGQVQGTKEFEALVTQSGTDAPTAIILKNTLGDMPIFTYVSVGVYNMTLAGTFVDGKTIKQITPQDQAFSVGIQHGMGDGVLTISSGHTVSGVSDDILANTSLSIKVYP